MNNTMDLSKCTTHDKVIIHLDLDCFYAQVEMIKNPDLRIKPLGVKQKNIVVTTNYIAREYGIKKCMFVSEALNLCPQLVLVNGEDLKNYRQMSSKVTSILNKYTPLVERLGLDENFLDVTAMVKEYFQNDASSTDIVGNVYTDSDITSEEQCYCGCIERLSMGTQIAQNLRNVLFDELGLTCSAGISYNKLLAKLVGSVHKPNQQTILFPEKVESFMKNLDSVRAIPGIGQKTFEILSSLGITNVSDVKLYPVDKLQVALGKDVGDKVQQLCDGYDVSVVKPSGKPQTIGLEDSCRNLHVDTEVEVKFKQLLCRLMELVVEDGRIPTTIKVTIRKFDPGNKTSYREQKQCNISTSLFSSGNTISLLESSRKKLLGIIMRLFYKLVDIHKPFHLTLLGLSFTKFQERKFGRSAITSFLMNNVTVQEVTNLQNDTIDKNIPSAPMEIVIAASQQNSWNFNTDGSESEAEPSPKKVRYDQLIAKRRCFNKSFDSASPSKLPVAALRLNSREFERKPMVVEEQVRYPIRCPPHVDESVFKELPPDIQEDIFKDWLEKQPKQKSVQNTKYTPNTIFKYFIPNN